MLLMYFNGTRVGAGIHFFPIPLHAKPQARSTTSQQLHYFLEIFIIYLAARNILNPFISTLASPQASFLHDHVQAT